MTPANLYNMAMESNTAGDLMHELCKLLGTPYPPAPDDYTEIVPVFDFSNGQPAPVTLAH